MCHRQQVQKKPKTEIRNPKSEIRVKEAYAEFHGESGKVADQTQKSIITTFETSWEWNFFYEIFFMKGLYENVGTKIHGILHRMMKYGDFNYISVSRARNLQSSQ